MRPAAALQVIEQSQVLNLYESLLSSLQGHGLPAQAAGVDVAAGAAAGATAAEDGAVADGESKSPS